MLCRHRVVVVGLLAATYQHQGELFQNSNMTQPFADEGASDWFNITPVSVVGRRRTYVELPAFDIENPDWVGASQIVAQYNFSAAQNFYFLKLPTKPTGVNFGLCVRYRVGETVYRYKLWDDDRFILSDDVDVAPELLNETNIIKKNFVLEIWSFEGEADSSLETAIRIKTSPKTVPTDMRVRTDVALAAGAYFDNLFNTNTPAASPTTTNRCGWFRPDDYGIVADGPTATPGPLANAEASLNMTNLNDTSGVNVYAGANALNGHAWLRFDGANDYMNSAFTGSIQALDRTYVGVMRIYASGVDSDGWIVADYLDSAMAADKLAHYDDTHVYVEKKDGSDDFANALPLVESEWVIFYMTVDRTGNILKVFIEGIGENEVSSGNVNASATDLYLGNDPNFVGINAGKFDLAELIVYNAILSAADLATNLQYLGSKYLGGISLPLTFDSDGPWLDNT